LQIIADNLRKTGWSWGWFSAVDSEGRTIWIADALRDDGQRFIVRADELLTAFVELESAIGKIALTLSVGGWQSRARVKSVGRLPKELHLALFPQG
jgi:hypothetical protein